MLFLLLPTLSQGQLANTKIATPLKDSISTKHLWLAAQILPGSGQIINKQYWKVPVYYAGMGSMIFMGIRSNNAYKHSLSEYNDLDPASSSSELYKQRYTREKQNRNLFYAGAGAFYIASVMDAILVYNKNEHSPATATILSTILPGAGQIYNKKIWKVPAVYALFGTFYFLVDWNNRGYIQFKRAIRQWPKDEFGGIRTQEELKLYRDIYRKNRDLSFLGLIGVYVLNIVDANVDGNLYNWSVSDDLSFRIEPSIINNNFATTAYTQPAFGLTCKFNF